MENKFKLYLQNEFQKIPPTKASMEYRKKLLLDLLDYAQELKIKGISNDEIIYDLAIKNLGDMDTLLQEFENKRLNKNKLKKKRLAAIISVLSIMVPTILIYLTTSLVVKPSIWSWSWIIILGGVFATVTTLIMLYMINNKAKFSALFIRLGVLAIAAMWIVFISLVLLIINLNVSGVKIEKWYVAFIAIPAVLALTDMVTSLATKSKGKWINSAVDIIVFFVILYVVIGIFIPSFWHPGWLLILLGIALATIELGIVYGIKSKKIKKEKGNDNEVNEKFYTEW